MTTDVFYPDFLEGKPAYFDISVRNSMQLAYLTKSAYMAGAVTEAGEEEKDKKHNEDVTMVDHRVQDYLQEHYAFSLLLT